MFGAKFKIMTKQPLLENRGLLRDVRVGAHGCWHPWRNQGARRLARISLEGIERSEAMSDLIAGFLKFQETAYPQRRELFHQSAHAQTPGALFIACSDSRIVARWFWRRVNVAPRVRKTADYRRSNVTDPG
jgi:hypothetical protein